MAESSIAVQKNSLSGLNATFTAANVDGSFFENDGKTLLIVKNGGGTSVTVTVASQKQCNQGYSHDEAVAVPAGEERIVGPFLPSRFNDDSGCHVTYSAVTSVTVAAVSNS